MSTAETRREKRKLNELEQKIKKLQKELRQVKTDKKKVGSLRKQASRAFQREADCNEILNDIDVPRQSSKKEVLKCKHKECASDCHVIDVGSRLIAVCTECGSRYTIVK